MIGVAQNIIEYHMFLNQRGCWAYESSGFVYLNHKRKEIGEGFWHGETIVVRINQEERWIEFLVEGKSHKWLEGVYFRKEPIYFAVSMYGGFGKASWEIILLSIQGFQSWMYLSILTTSDLVMNLCGDYASNQDSESSSFQIWQMIVDERLNCLIQQNFIKVETN